MPKQPKRTKSLRDRARDLAQNHYCEPKKYCGIVEDIEHELEEVWNEAIEAASGVAANIANITAREHPKVKDTTTPYFAALATAEWISCDIKEKLRKK